MSPAEFQSVFDVPRGTIDKLMRYESMLREWQPRGNLVGPQTVDQIWPRHFADSAQIARIVPEGRRWLDMGAGAGFPGLVLATMGWGTFILAESVAKKCRFLEAVRDALDLQSWANVRCARVESIPPLEVEIVTARAMAPLSTLLEWAIRHVQEGGQCVFPKGRRWETEVENAAKRFLFDVEPFQSMTDPDARILVVHNLKRR
jgi:16S rRNA (guanine527-N7)-methyltransferase